MMRKDPFLQYRQQLKGVFVATKGPRSTKVIARALDYKTLRERMATKGLEKSPFAIKYLEPKGAICAYQISL